MRCPVCRAENDNVTCRRCKADLTLLDTLERARQRALADAMNAVKIGDGKRALESASEAHRLRADAESARLVALGHLLQREFARALAFHGSAREMPQV